MHINFSTCMHVNILCLLLKKAPEDGNIKLRDLKAAEKTVPSVIRCDSESTPLAFSCVGCYTAVIEDVTNIIVLYEREEMSLL